ncbi:hypothetical protein CRUP_037124, partial [Coryphaenoides rupestris]
VAFHIQPYQGRTDQSVHSNIKYIIEQAWAELLTVKGSHSVRGTPYDGVFVALVVEERHKNEILAGGFDGMYTYFASNGFSFGSLAPRTGAPSRRSATAQPAVRAQRGARLRRHGGAAGEQPQHAQHAGTRGTQIERAVPRKTVTRLYLDYQPNKPTLPGADAPLGPTL